MDYKEVNGVKFKVKYTRANYSNRVPIKGCNRDEIFECYKKPSIIKVGIWHSWCDWCNELNNKEDSECGIEISSYNCNFFSISGSLFMDNKWYDFYITYANRVLYEVN